MSNGDMENETGNFYQDVRPQIDQFAAFNLEAEKT